MILRMMADEESGEDTAPSVKDGFLAKLREVFGAEKAYDLYQKGEASEEDLATLIDLLAKFDLPSLKPEEVAAEVEMEADPPPADDPPKEDEEAKKEVEMRKTIETVTDGKMATMQKSVDALGKKLDSVLSMIKTKSNPLPASDPPKPEDNKPDVKCRADGKPLAFLPAK